MHVTEPSLHRQTTVWEPRSSLFYASNKACRVQLIGRERKPRIITAWWYDIVAAMEADGEKAKVIGRPPEMVSLVCVPVKCKMTYEYLR